MSYKTLKIINIILGVICLIIEIYVYSRSSPPPIDGIFVFIITVAVIETSVSLLSALRFQRPRGYRADSFIRGIGLATMGLSGGLLLYSAFLLQNDCTYTCPPWETRMIAAIIGLINAVIHGGAIYPLLPHNLTPTTFSRPVVFVSYPAQQGNNEHNLPSYDTVVQQNTEFVTPGQHPQQIYQIPRYPVQQVGIQNYNYIQHPEPPPTYVP